MEPKNRGVMKLSDDSIMWHKRILTLALPIILSNISVPLLGAVDTAVMGHLPDPVYIGAVAVGSTILAFIYWGFSFLRMGTTGLTAQAFGAENSREIRATLARALLLALGLGLLLVLLQAVIRPAGFYFMAASPQVENLAGRYFDIRIWGAPATLINYALLGWLLGAGKSRAVMTLQLLLNGLNIILDFFFVFGLGMTVEGVALATLISEYCALAVGLAIATSALKAWPAIWDLPLILNTQRQMALFKVNVDIFIRSLCLQVAFFNFISQSGRLGEVKLAGNDILLQMQLIMSFATDGFAQAVEVLAGNAFGARSRQRLRAAIIASTLWAMAFAVFFTGLFWTYGEAIIALFTDIPEVRQAAGVYLPWVVALPMLSVWSYQLDGIFIGATRTGAMRNAMVLSLVIYLIAVWVFVPLFGNHGLWLAFSLFMVGRAVTLGAFYPGLERSINEPGREAPKPAAMGSV